MIDDAVNMLNERNPIARDRMLRIARVCGINFVTKMIERTLEVEQNGGMLTIDKSRRRTSGGIFFYLIHEYLRDRQRRNANWRKRSQELSDIYPDLQPGYKPPLKRRKTASQDIDKKSDSSSSDKRKVTKKKKPE